MTTQDSSAVQQDSAWQCLAHNMDDDFYGAWLALQCGLIGEVSSGLLLARHSPAGELECQAVWPQPVADVAPLYHLSEQVISANSGMISLVREDAVSGVGNSTSKKVSTYAIALPVYDSEQTCTSVDAIVAVVAIQINAQDKAELQAAMRQLQWGSAWISAAVTARIAEQRAPTSASVDQALDLLSAVMGESHYERAVHRLLAEINTRYRCELVVLGRRKAHTTVVSHISNTAQHGKKMDRVRAIETAMNEAVDQHSAIQFPAPTASSQITKAHAALIAHWPDHQALSIPLFIDEQCQHVLTLIRHKDNPISPRERQICEHALAFIAVSLEDKRLNDRRLWQRLCDSVVSGGRVILGSKYMGRKFAAIVAVVSIGFLAFAQGVYRLSSDAVVMPLMQRVIVAPFDGYIEAADYRAGDQVRENDVIVRFDASDLRLEQLRLSSELNQLQQQSQQAIAKYERAKMTILDAQMAQTRAKLALIKNQLLRTEQRVPFDGIVVSGDLSQKIGAAVTTGEALFDVAPMNQLRVFIDVKESRIADIKLGQRGQLYLSALPTKNIPIYINKITPVTNVRDGATYFRVEAQIEGKVDQLQPGMEGISKIVIDERKLLSIWTRELMEWLRLFFWRVWG